MEVKNDHGHSFYVPEEKMGCRTPGLALNYTAIVDQSSNGASAPTAEKPGLTAQQRKERPLYRGLLKYFPDALMEVANCSWVGNEQHNPGEDLHWAKEKSTDEADALMRHLIDAGTRDSDGIRHSAKVAWRALALLQREIEKEKAPG
jgi:hypothetical protein